MTVIVHRWRSKQNLIPLEHLVSNSIFLFHRKDQLESQIVTYLDIETFIGRCPGYYFRKCLQSRSTMKSRVHYDVVKRSSLVRKCCPGYLEYDGECIPYCMAGCPNGNCTRPNHCTCYDGYEEDEFNRSSLMIIDLSIQLRRVVINRFQMPTKMHWLQTWRMCRSECVQLQCRL